jgi:energy-coupling factor transport system permease protein
MSVVFSNYVPGSSLLHRLDPRVKLWMTGLMLAAIFMMPSLTAQAALLVVVHALLIASGVPWSSLGSLWRQMSILVILILVLQPFLRPAGAELLRLGPLALTVGGVMDAARLALRALNIAFFVAGLLFTTEHRALVRALVRLGLPYTWGLTISLALRFLPAIQSLFRAVHDAQAARGWVAQGNPLRRLREYLPVLVAVIIGTLRMSDQLTLALAVRGLEHSKERTTWRDIRMGGRDWLLLALSTVIFAFFTWWHFTQSAF